MKAGFKKFRHASREYVCFYSIYSHSSFSNKCPTFFISQVNLFGFFVTSGDKTTWHAFMASLDFCSAYGFFGNGFFSDPQGSLAPDLRISRSVVSPQSPPGGQMIKLNTQPQEVFKDRDENDSNHVLTCTCSVHDSCFVVASTNFLKHQKNTPFWSHEATTVVEI